MLCHKSLTKVLVALAIMLISSSSSKCSTCTTVVHCAISLILIHHHPNHNPGLHVGISSPRIQTSSHFYRAACMQGGQPGAKCFLSVWIVKTKKWKDYRIGTLQYKWPISAYVSQAFSTYTSARDWLYRFGTFTKETSGKILYTLSKVFSPSFLKGIVVVADDPFYLKFSV